MVVSGAKAEVATTAKVGEAAKVTAVAGLYHD